MSLFGTRGDREQLPQDQALKAKEEQGEVAVAPECTVDLSGRWGGDCFGVYLDLTIEQIGCSAIKIAGPLVGSEVYDIGRLRTSSESKGLIDKNSSERLRWDKDGKILALFTGESYSSTPSGCNLDSQLVGYTLSLSEDKKQLFLKGTKMNISITEGKVEPDVTPSECTLLPLPKK